MLAAISGEADAIALDAAPGIAHRQSRTVVALRVLEGISSFGTSLEFAMPPVRVSTDRYDDVVDALSRQVARAPHSTSAWTSRVTYGDPSRTIAETALEEHASCIVMGRGRRDVGLRLRADRCDVR